MTTKPLEASTPCVLFGESIFIPSKWAYRIGHRFWFVFFIPSIVLTWCQSCLTTFLKLVCTSSGQPLRHHFSLLHDCGISVWQIPASRQVLPVRFNTPSSDCLPFSICADPLPCPTCPYLSPPAICLYRVIYLLFFFLPSFLLIPNFNFLCLIRAECTAGAE